MRSFFCIIKEHMDEIILNVSESDKKGPMLSDSDIVNTTKSKLNELAVTKMDVVIKHGEELVKIIRI